MGIRLICYLAYLSLKAKVIYSWFKEVFISDCNWGWVFIDLWDCQFIKEDRKVRYRIGLARLSELM